MNSGGRKLWLITNNNHLKIVTVFQKTLLIAERIEVSGTEA
jgi:hypothetical protein